MLFLIFPVLVGVEYELFIQLLNFFQGFGKAILSPSFKRIKLLQSPCVYLFSSSAVLCPFYYIPP